MTVGTQPVRLISEHKCSCNTLHIGMCTADLGLTISRQNLQLVDRYFFLMVSVTIEIFLIYSFISIYGPYLQWTCCRSLINICAPHFAIVSYIRTRLIMSTNAGKRTDKQLCITGNRYVSIFNGVCDSLSSREDQYSHAVWVQCPKIIHVQKLKAI